MKSRNFNVKYAVLFGIIGAILYGAVISGRMIGVLFGNIPTSERPLSDQIIYIEPEHQETEVVLLEPGNYRVLSAVGTLYASNITIHEQDTNTEIPTTYLDRTKLAPYDGDQLNGIALLDFEVVEAGTYLLQIHDFDVTKRALKLTVFQLNSRHFLHSLVYQRLVLVVVSVLALAAVGYFIWTSKPILSRKQRKVKQAKWAEFMDEN